MSDITGERWLPIPDYEGRYEVSDQGRVRSLLNTRNRLRSKPMMRRSQRNRAGYLVVTLCADGVCVGRYVHHLVMHAFVGPRPGGMEIRHLSGDPADSRLANLKYGTSAENTADMMRQGRSNQANKTHCPRGHPYSGANLYETPNYINRVCRTCQRAYKIEWRNKRRAAGLPVT